MNDYIFVEFLFSEEERINGINKITNLGDDFELKNQTTYNGRYCIISGRIKSATATMIKLEDIFLSTRMRISYIPSSLKSKYRNTTIGN